MALHLPLNFLFISLTPSLQSGGYGMQYILNRFNGFLLFPYVRPLVSDIKKIFIYDAIIKEELVTPENIKI